MLQFPIHGANFTTLYQRFDIAQPETVYDLSENVNHLGPPKAVVDSWLSLIQEIKTYPHPDGEPLKSLLVRKHHLALDQLLLGNGAAELLTFFAFRFKGKRVLLIHPTFSEYKMTLEAAGALIEEIKMTEIQNYELPLEQIKQAMQNAACLYLCNPNNPTGAIINRAILEDIIDHGKTVGCEVLVDEAFMDWTDESNSVIDITKEMKHVTVLRSMTKMYGIAGLRLGYIIGNPQLIKEMKSKLPHWNVNALAIKVGEICLQDTQFHNNSIQFIKNMKQDIQDYLENKECIVMDSAANFLCFQLKEPNKTRDFYFYCLERGVVLRHTENYSGMDGKWLRIAIKGNEAMNYFKNVMDEWNG